MPECSLIFECPVGIFFCGEIVFQVFDLIRSEYQVEGWVDKAGRPINNLGSLLGSIESSRPHDYEQFGLTWTAKSTGDRPIVVAMANGGDEHALNSLEIDFSRRDLLPSLDLFVQVAYILKPNEAYYYFAEIERVFRSFLRSYGTKRFATKTLRCVHYFGTERIEAMGGLDRFLKLKTAKVTRCADGLLIQLTSSLDNYRQNNVLGLQLDAMKHLGMVDSSAPSEISRQD